MTQTILSAVILLCGAIYAWKAETFLARKYRDAEAPPLAVRVARVSGIFVALVGAVLLFHSL